MDNFVISLSQNLEISETLKLSYLLRKYILNAISWIFITFQDTYIFVRTQFTGPRIVK